jgi:hypothetical protein
MLREATRKGTLFPDERAIEEKLDGIRIHLE